MHQLVHAISVGTGPISRAAKAGVKSVTPRGIRRRALAATRRKFIYVEPPPPDERLMAELRQGFKGEVEALSEYLGRDLVRLWGYDRV
jgi:hypothetical protein